MQKVDPHARPSVPAVRPTRLRVFSGIQPTGVIHIGNYAGAIAQWAQMQREFDSYFCIVDLHAITVPYEPEEFPQLVLDAAAANLAAGIDPQLSVLFVQSHIPEHTELMWLLNVITPLGQLERMTQYKDRARRSKVGVMVGLLNYPVLMAADVLLYKGGLVPVGDDQVQHVELMRDIAERFNKQFGDTFPLPEVRLSKAARIMALNDPQVKMSKSVPGSYLSLVESPEEIRKKIRTAVTDPGPPAKGSKLTDATPGVANLFTLLEVFAPSRYPQFVSAYQSGAIKYSELKQVLADAMIETFTPFRDRYQQLIARPDEVRDILADGARRARPVAQATMEEVRQKMGLR
jgi:tryptophanyl-tRNA synthetase